MIKNLCYFLCFLMMFVLPTYLSAAMPKFAMVFKAGMEGSDTGNLKSTIDPTVDVINVQPGKFFEFELEWWPAENLGLQATYQKMGKRKTTSEFLGRASDGTLYLFSQTSGHIDQNRLFVGPILRIGFLQGRLAIIAQYEKIIIGKINLEHDQQAFGVINKDEIKETGTRLSAGVEYQFTREAGLRALYSVVKSQWQEVNTLITAGDVEFATSQLSISYVYRF